MLKTFYKIGISFFLIFFFAGCFSGPNETSIIKSNPQAKVVFTECIDLQNPQSKIAHDNVKILSQEYGDKLRIEFRHFPISSIHKDAFRAAVASECARGEGKLWEFIDKVFENQSNLTQETLIQHAVGLNIDREKFASCLDNAEYEQKINADIEFAKSKNIGGAPTYLINDSIIPPLKIDALREKVQEEIKKSEG